MNAAVVAESVARSAARAERWESASRPHDPTAVLCPNAPFCPDCLKEQIAFNDRQRGIAPRLSKGERK